MTINYPKMYTKVYKNEVLARFLKVVSAVSVFAFVVSVCLSLVATLIGSGLLAALQLAVILGLPFAVLSLVRRCFDMPRPCQTFDFSELGIDDSDFKRGGSFPSRHVFSGFLISTALFPTLPVLGGLLLLLAAFLAMARVLLGMHFIRDVLVGASLGVASALIGLFILG